MKKGENISSEKIYLTEDKGIYKQIIRNGTGSAPQKG